MNSRVDTGPPAFTWRDPKACSNLRCIEQIM